MLEVAFIMHALCKAPSQILGLMINFMEYVDILIYTKSNALMHFIDAHITELSTTHRLVCSRQDKWRAII